MVDFGFGPDFCFSGLTALSGIAHALPSRSAPSTVRPGHIGSPIVSKRPTCLLFPVRIDSLSKPHLFLSSIITGHRLDTRNAVSHIKLLLYATSRR